MVYAALGLPASLALVAALRHCLLPVFSRPGDWVAIRWQLAPAQAALLQAAGLGLLVACGFSLCCSFRGRGYSCSETEGPLAVVTSAVAGGLWETEKGCNRDVQGLWVAG